MTAAPVNAVQCSRVARHRRFFVGIPVFCVMVLGSVVALSTSGSPTVSDQTTVPRGVLGTLNHVISVQAQPGLTPRDRLVFGKTFASEWQDAAAVNARIAKRVSRANPAAAEHVSALGAAMQRVAQCWTTNVPDFLSRQEAVPPFYTVSLPMVCGAPVTHPDGGTSPWTALDQAVAKLGIHCKAAGKELECGPKLAHAPLGVPHALFATDCFTGNIGEDDHVVDCQEPHNGEVFSLIDYPTGPSSDFPGLDVVRAYAVEHCTAEFAGYVGIDEDASKYDHVAISSISAETWAQGDRSILCYLVSDDGDAVTGSAKGTRT